MGLHDGYTVILSSSKEYGRFKKGELEANSLLYEELKKKYKLDYKISRNHVEAIKSYLPDDYHPSQDRIDEQKRVCNELHDEIFSTCYEMEFNDAKRAISYVTASRSDQAYYAYVALYGTEKNKARIKEITDKIYASAKAEKEALKKPNNTEAIDAAREDLYDSIQELEEFKKDTLVDEVRRAAKEAVNIQKLMDECNTPGKMFANYKNIRKHLAFFTETDSILPNYKDLFSKEEYDEFTKAFGPLFGRSMEFLSRAGAMANPLLAENFDMEELKTVSDQTFTDLHYGLQDLEEFASADEDDESAENDENTSLSEKEREQKKAEKEKELAIEQKRISAEVTAMSDMFRSGKYVYGEWVSEINNYYGLGEGDVMIRTVDGVVKKLDEKVMAQLYNDGLPFFAFSKNADKAEGVICMPTVGRHLAVGEDAISKIDTVTLGEVRRPNSLLFALDSFVHFLKDNWRINSVAKYENDIELYNKEVELRGTAKYALKMAKDPKQQTIAKNFAGKLYAKYKKEALEAEQKRLREDAAQKKLTIEEYKELVQNQLEEQKLKNSLLEKCITALGQAGKQIAELKAMGMPRANARRIRLALEQSNTLVKDELMKEEKDFVKVAATIVVRNAIANEMDEVVHGKHALDKLPTTLDNIFKDNKPVEKVENSIKQLAENKLFAKYVNSMDDVKKTQLFDNLPTEPEQREKLEKFVSEFKKFTEAEEAKNKAIKKYDLNAGKHREVAQPVIKMP